MAWETWISKKCKNFSNGGMAGPVPDPAIFPVVGGVGRILILEEHPAMRLGLRGAIQKHSALEVCCEASNGRDALRRVARNNVDLVIMGLKLPDRNGLEMIKDLKTLKPELPVLIVSMHDEQLYAERVLRAGADGYIMKQENLDKLLGAIETVLAGKIYLSDRMSVRALHSFGGRGTPDRRSAITALTDREFEIFELIGQGLSTQEIALQLRLSPKTVETHRLRMRDKLKLTTGNDLLRHAMRWAASQQLL